jgi:uncharacterized repeat protein (TIGR04042 family)
MPEMHMSIVWPDGSEERCYSPSLVLKDYFRVGDSYALADFRVRSRTALTIAGERVRAKFGYACSRAAQQLARIEQRCLVFADLSDAQVHVKAFHE